MRLLLAKWKSRVIAGDESRDLRDDTVITVRDIGRVVGPACAYGQVIKMRRNDWVIRGEEERKVMIGAERVKQAMQDSEDSVKLNNSFVDRLNLTIRQGSAYLGRRTPCLFGEKNFGTSTCNSRRTMMCVNLIC